MESHSEKIMHFAERTGVRRDWHEPDEQSVTAKIYGDHLDNAMGDFINELDGDLYPYTQEFVVVLSQEGGETLRLNLATLLAHYTRLAKKELELEERIRVARQLCPGVSI